MNYTDEQITHEIDMCELEIHTLNNKLSYARRNSYALFSEIRQLEAQIENAHIQLANWQNLLLLDDEQAADTFAASSDNNPSPIHRKPARKTTNAERWARVDYMRESERTAKSWYFLVSFWQRQGW